MKNKRYSGSLIHFASRYLKHKAGSVLPFVALTFPALLGMVGLGTDASLWMADKRNLQMSADAAVIAAGWEIAQDTASNMDFMAFKEATNNGYDAGANGELELQILSSDPTNGTVLAITLEQDSDTFFSKIIFSDPIRVSAYAEALIGDTDGEYCILALEETGANAVTNFGSSIVNSPGCGIAVNSTSDEALSLSGNSEMTISTVRISGNYEVGNTVDFTYNSLRTGQAPIDDPYDYLEVPEHEACDESNLRINSSTTLSPGTYCGGLNISGDIDVTFDPGVYIIDGDDFKVTGQGNLYGEGVTFILTGSGNNYAGLDISGAKTIEFTAPEAGDDWSGITFFQDRNAPQRDNLQNKLVGTSDIIIDGVLYFPSQGLWFGGDTTVVGGDNPCTKLIARTVTLAGNPRLGNNCDLYDVEDVGLPSVKLIR